MMPQKRNPDAAELVRASPAVLLGAFSALTVLMKGLPLAYNKDMQQDKRETFAALDDLLLGLRVSAGMCATLRLDPSAMRQACERGYPTATDAADWLVRHLHLPFRRAHGITARLVALAEGRGCALSELPLADMQQVEGGIDARIYDALSLDTAFHARNSYGSAAPARVRVALQEVRQSLARERAAAPPPESDSGTGARGTGCAP